MIITDAQYRKDSADTICSVQATIDGVIWQVPLDEGNVHYAEILKQVADGTITITEAD